MSVRIAILTVSDGCAAGAREDRSGAAIAAWVREQGHEVAAHVVVPDETHRIATQLIHWADAGDTAVILTTGGTGLGPRDVTPEATRAVIERDAPGLAEALRSAGLRQTPRAALSRGVAGTRGKCLIVNLPGSTKGVADGLATLGPLVEHIAALLRGETEH
ncbi:MAG TPA: MogA/MoaB family molybdenum cofactor biosynthesis protein [Gemmatimonadales bacterium]